MHDEVPFLPFALPSIGEDDIAEVTAVLRSGWVTTGPRTAAFERAFADAVGARHALAVNSATAGLHLALEALGVRTGDRVITTVHTFTATAEVIRYLGADPLFVDIDPATLNIDPAQVAAVADAALARGERVRALLPVHFAGLAADMRTLGEIARTYELAMVEDAAHAFPATSAGRNIGTISNASVFSFYATKTITTGEGGMVTTDDDAVASRIKTMRLHGINRDVWDRYNSRVPSWYYEVVAPGFKYNMTDIAAALGMAQLAKAEAFRRRRQVIAKRYDAAFADLPLVLPPQAPRGDIHAWHLYALRLDLDRLRIDRDRFIETLATRGVGSSVHFIPLHLQPYWRDRYGLRPQDFPHASAVYRRAVSLPIYPAMTDSDVVRVIESVRDIVLRHQA